MVSLYLALALLIILDTMARINFLQCIWYHAILVAENPSMIPYGLQDQVQTPYQSKRIFVLETLSFSASSLAKPPFMPYLPAKQIPLDAL